MELYRPISPHGGRLVNTQLQGDALTAAFDQARYLTKIPLTTAVAADVSMIATGAYSPLMGFMNRADYYSVLKDMRLVNGCVWPLPITLAVTNGQAQEIRVGGSIALTQNEQIIAVMDIEEKFPYNKMQEARQVYQTTSEKHPGVMRLMDQDDILLAGPIKLLRQPFHVGKFNTPHKPLDTRRLIQERQWTAVAGFQTRNPIHFVHEHIFNDALNNLLSANGRCGLLLHPLVGETKSDDIPAGLRFESYHFLVNHFYQQRPVMLGAFPAPMRFAGPREALFHALCRQNYGCTHFIVGRDHAGVGNFYAPDAAHKIFDEFAKDEIGIEILRYQHKYCELCGGLVEVKNCSHSNDISGSEVRAMLKRGQYPPSEIMRPEISQLLIAGLNQTKHDPYSYPQSTNPYWLN